jgi:putative methyltransferase (TIGR04325 family)
MNLIFNFLNKISYYLGRVSLEKEYATWEDAKKNSLGYDHYFLFKKLKKIYSNTKIGLKFFERDTIIFKKLPYNKTFLNLISNINNKFKYINILDFGGSLGSSFFLYQKKICNFDYKWNIVEQKHIVDFGKRKLENKKFKFFYNIEQCLKYNKKNKINLFFTSDVIQYLESPYNILRTATKSSVPFILIDLLANSNSSDDKIYVQKIPKSIYLGSYPIRIFAKKKILNFMKNNGYDLIFQKEYKGVFFGIQNSLYLFKNKKRSFKWNPN